MYNYAIIQENHVGLRSMSVLDNNPYNAKKKYALLVKGVHKDSSESVYYIKYSNDLEELHTRAKAYPTWYNYPIGISKDLEGNLKEI